MHHILDQELVNTLCRDSRTLGRYASVFQEACFSERLLSCVCRVLCLGPVCVRVGCVGLGCIYSIYIAERFDSIRWEYLSNADQRVILFS